MKAIGFRTSLPISDQNSFIEFDKEIPQPKNRDLLIKIDAISVNPVDYKVRQDSLKDKTQEIPKIIGWDAVGIVEAVGEQAQLFKKGDRVFYAGDITRDGSNQQYQLVDERIVGLAPKKITSEEIAAMPLTSLTAYELLIDRLELSFEKDKGKSILIIGGAGGVGSVAIQLAKKLLNMTVITTASRDVTINWCLEMGADFVVNHNNLIDNVGQVGFENVDYIIDLVNVNQYWEAFVELIKPQGKIGSISDPTENVNLIQLKNKAVSFHWELMFTRSMFQTEDMQRQHDILNHISQLLDDGIIKSTLKQTLDGFDVDNVKEAHAILESRKSVGKVVIKF